MTYASLQGFFSDEYVFRVMMTKTKFARQKSGEKHKPNIVSTVRHPLSIMVSYVISGKETGRL